MAHQHTDTANDTAHGGLFPEPTPDGAYPREVLVETSVAAGLRYVVLGEEDDWVVFLGRPNVADIRDAAKEIIRGWNGSSPFDEPGPDLAPDELPTADNLTVTHGLLITSCPHHLAAVDDGSCGYCHASPENWAVDWSRELVATANPRDLFPITVWPTQ